MSQVTIPATSEHGAPKLFGLLAEYPDVPSMMKAARKVRDAGYRKWEVYTPFPVHGLDEVLGQKPTILPWLVLLGGITGCSLGLFLVWWTNATSFAHLPYALRGYDFVISGKPIFSLPANIPPIFELTILLSSITAFWGMLGLNMLPRYYHPAFRSARFLRASQDRFFIGIEAADPIFDPEQTSSLLRGEGATAVEELED